MTHSTKPRILLIANDVPGTKDIITFLLARNPHIEFDVCITRGLSARNGNFKTTLKFVRTASFRFMARRSIDLLRYYLAPHRLRYTLKVFRTTSWTVSNINSPTNIECIKKNDYDLVFMLYSMHILSSDFISAMNSKVFGVHPSLIPAYRGLEPFFWVLSAGEEITGVSIFKVKNEIDAGIIVRQRPIMIRPDETVNSLYTKLALELAYEIDSLIGEMLPQQLKKISPQAPSYFSMPDRKSYVKFLQNGKKWD